MHNLYVKLYCDYLLDCIRAIIRIHGMYHDSSRFFQNVVQTLEHYFQSKEIKIPGNLRLFTREIDLIFSKEVNNCELKIGALGNLTNTNIQKLNYNTLIKQVLGVGGDKCKLS